MTGASDSPSSVEEGLVGPPYAAGTDIYQRPTVYQNSLPDVSAGLISWYKHHHMVHLQHTLASNCAPKTTHSIRRSANSADLAAEIRRFSDSSRNAFQSQGGPTWLRE